MIILSCKTIAYVNESQIVYMYCTRDYGIESVKDRDRGRHDRKINDGGHLSFTRTRSETSRIKIILFVPMGKNKRFSLRRCSRRRRRRRLLYFDTDSKIAD